MPFHKSLCFILTALLFASLTWLLSIFFWPSKIFVMNDFTDITSKTLITPVQQTSQPQQPYWVDNIDFINQHHFLGLTRYNPLTHQLPDPTSGSSVKILEAPSSEPKTNLELGLYNSRLQAYVIGHLRDTKARAQTIALFADPGDKSRIEAAYRHWDDPATAQQYALHGEEQRQFYQKNKYNMITNTKTWHYFHHHDAMIGPISAYSLGQANNHNNFFYGWLNNVMLYKLILLTGEFNFQHYLEVLYSFYPIYYFFWIVLLYALTRNPVLTLLGTLLACSNVFLTSFEEMRFQPGLNPFRHGFDLALIACYSVFLSQKIMARYATLLITTALVFFAILCNTEFGLSIAAAFIGSLLIYSFAQSVQRWLKVFFIALGIGAVGLACTLLPHPDHSVLKYFFFGVATPNASFTLIYLIGAFNCGIYLFLLFDTKNSLESKTLILFMSFYYQAFAFYYIIYTASAHIRTSAPIAIIGLMLLLKNLLAYIPLYERKHFWTALFIPSSILFALSVMSYSGALPAFFEHQKNHQRYFWDFKRAQFNTDMDPRPFKNALALIERYSQQPDILMISKYDTILMWLSDHYNQIPYRSLGITMPSKTEEQIAVASIKNSTSCTLFVDADIASNHFGDIHMDPPSFPEKSKLDAVRISDIFAVKSYYALAEVFYQIQDDYHLQEKGDLIDVYRANRCQEIPDAKPS